MVNVGAKVEIITFQGTPVSFFSCIEIITTKRKPNLLNFTVEKNENSVRINMKISSTHKEYKAIVESLLDSLKTYYLTQFGSDINITFKKQFVYKEILLDMLHLKN